MPWFACFEHELITTCAGEGVAMRDSIVATCVFEASGLFLKRHVSHLTCNVRFINHLDAPSLTFLLME